MRFTAYLALLMTILLWAGNWVVGRAIRNELPPALGTLGRLAIVIVCIGPLAFPGLRARLAAMNRPQWKLLLASGVIGGGVHLAMQWQALHYTTATSATLFVSSAPIFIMILAAAFARERIRARQWLGIGISFSGIALLASNGDLRALATLSLNVGDLFVLGSMFMFAMYTVLLKRRDDPLGFLQYLLLISCIGAVTLLPWVAWELGHAARGPLTTAAILAMLYSAFGSFLFAYLGWNYAVPRIGAARTGAFMHLMPAFAVVLAAIFLGEYPQWFHFAGIALIITGVAISRT